MNKYGETDLANKISLPKGLITHNNDPVISIELPLTAEELELIRTALINRQEAVLNQLCHLKTSRSHVNAQIENNVLLSVSKKVGKIKSEKRYPLEVLDVEWKEILYCLEHTRNKSKAAHQLIKFLSECLEV
ncbi:MAG: hypothetical protein NC253_14310 [Ruminococcus sp.]|nr:hypothetical protein [Ruminococcus sp.]MCM1381681.1 hypothetical protein [Muribaculaceae bacterium]MCM1480466.1 hypothetical protein [Muribaculaceae bacterium]